MLLTRRTFVQSSLAASLVVAAEATHTGWLLKPDDPVRIAIAGLGPAADEHLSLFSALPGARIVALADPSHANLTAGIDRLTQLGRPRPYHYTSLSSLLEHCAVDAVSLPADEGSTAFSLREVLSTRLPILADLPPRNFSHGGFLALENAPVRFRTADRLYPGAQTNIHAQWKRPSLQPESDLSTRSARLMLERRLPPPQLRAVLLAALEAVFDYRSTPTTQLAVWTKNPKVIEFGRASTTLHIHLPPQVSPFDRLDVDLLPKSSGASILSLGQPNRTMEVPIWRMPDSHSSLCTAMAFLSHTRSPLTNQHSVPETGTTDTATDASRAFAAASIVDRALSFVYRN